MEELIDETGRHLKLRKVGVLETLRLYKALGAELAENYPYVALATAACAVTMIDEVPVPFPANEAAVERLIRRLGDDTISLISKAIKPPAFEKVINDAGNSQGTQH